MAAHAAVDVRHVARHLAVLPAEDPHRTVASQERNGIRAEPASTAHPALRATWLSSIVWQKMKPVEIAVILVLLIMGGRLAFAEIKGRAVRRGKKQSLERLVTRRFPGARFTLSLPGSAWIGAELDYADHHFQLRGCYLSAEGGDGFLHVHKVSGTSRVEIGRVSLTAAENQYDIIELGRQLIGQHTG